MIYSIKKRGTSDLYVIFARIGYQPQPLKIYSYEKIIFNARPVAVARHGCVRTTVSRRKDDAVRNRHAGHDRCGQLRQPVPEFLQILRKRQPDRIPHLQKGRNDQKPGTDQKIPEAQPFPRYRLFFRNDVQHGDERQRLQLDDKNRSRTLRSHGHRSPMEKLGRHHRTIRPYGSGCL